MSIWWVLWYNHNMAQSAYDRTKHPTRLVVVRHGESEANVFQENIDRGEAFGYGAEYSKVNDYDVALTHKGREQARAVGRYLKERFGYFDYSFVSTFCRTRETFDGIIEGYGEIDARSRFMDHMRYDTRLREKDYGSISFYSKEDVQKLFPNEVARLTREGKYLYRPLGGESWYDVKDNRVTSILNTIYRMLMEKSVLIVTHTVVMKCFGLKIEHIEMAEDIERFDRDNPIQPGGISVFEYDPDHGNSDRLSLKEWNMTASE